MQATTSRSLQGQASSRAGGNNMMANGDIMPLPAGMTAEEMHQVIQDRHVAIKYLQKAKSELETHILSEGNIPSPDSLKAIEIYNEAAQTLHSHHTDTKLAVSGVKTGECMDAQGHCTCEKPVTLSSLLINPSSFQQPPPPVSEHTAESLRVLNENLKSLKINTELSLKDLEVKEAPKNAPNGLGPYSEHFTSS